MAKQPKDPAQSAARAEAAAHDLPPAPAGVTPSPAYQEEQIAQLRDLVGSLTDAVNDMQVRNAQKLAFDDTVAELKQTARALAVVPGVPGTAPERGQECGGECSCVASDCCCFDIYVWKVRAAKPQIEPADMGDIPALTNALEVKFYVTVNEIGFLFPSLGTSMELRADGMPGGPGAWVVLKRKINRVCFKKGTTETVEVKVEVLEEDAGVERPIGMKDEHGEASGWITLDCCTEKVYPPMPIDVYLHFGGEGKGMVQVAFYAERVCC